MIPVQCQQGQLQFGQLGLRLDQLPLSLKVLLPWPDVKCRHRPRHRLGSGGVHVNSPSLDNCPLEDSPGVGCFARVHHRHEAEALGAFLVEDDLGVHDGAILTEENHQVWVPEAEGQVGDVQPAAEVEGALGLIAVEEVVRGSLWRRVEKASRGRLDNGERRIGRCGQLEGALSRVATSKDLARQARDRVRCFGTAVNCVKKPVAINYLLACAIENSSCV